LNATVFGKNMDVSNRDEDFENPVGWNSTGKEVWVN
jgi:hypothetical protein